jgi:hypothetical protein
VPTDLVVEVQRDVEHEALQRVMRVIHHHQHQLIRSPVGHPRAHRADQLGEVVVELCEPCPPPPRCPLSMARCGCLRDWAGGRVHTSSWVLCQLFRRSST